MEKVGTPEDMEGSMLDFAEGVQTELASLLPDHGQR